jgi:hypothetical protein
MPSSNSPFNLEDVKVTEQAIRDWKKKFPEAAEALKILWKAQLMVAGHKTMGREIQSDRV